MLCVRFFCLVAAEPRYVFASLRETKIENGLHWQIALPPHRPFAGSRRGVLRPALHRVFFKGEDFHAHHPPFAGPTRGA